MRGGCLVHPSMQPGGSEPSTAMEVVLLRDVEAFLCQSMTDSEISSYYSCEGRLSVWDAGMPRGSLYFLQIHFLRHLHVEVTLYETVISKHIYCVKSMTYSQNMQLAVPQYQLRSLVNLNVCLKREITKSRCRAIFK